MFSIETLGFYALKLLSTEALFKRKMPPMSIDGRALHARTAGQRFLGA